MKKIHFVLFLCTLWIKVGDAFASDLPSVTHYSLRLHLFQSEQRFEAEVQMTITNKTQRSFSEIPFLLYRLLDAQAVTDESGSAVRFRQSIQKFKEVPTWQANLIHIELPEPLHPSKSITITMKYSGSVYGYPEVMQYVRDRIDEVYSLIRPDAFAYPMLSLPSFPVLLASYQSKFTFDIQATVPSGYVVACGGRLISSTSKGDSVIFAFEGKGPVSRMDIAIARFKTLSDDSHNLSVYFLPEDEQGASDVLHEMKRVIELYSSLFGQVKNYKGYTTIEIPEGWGSQADDYSILQAASAFKERKFSEVYHEVAHTWNVKAKPEVQRCRWFDEAFATYFEALATREFKGDSAFQKHMEGLRERWLQRAAKDKKNFDTPIAEYAKEELGQNSYTKGAWSLYVLHQLVGEEHFGQIIRTLLSEFGDKPADFRDFQRISENVSKMKLGRFFDEWIYGTQSSQLLADKAPVTAITKRY